VNMTLAGVLGLIAAGYVIVFHASVSNDLPDTADSTGGA